MRPNRLRELLNAGQPSVGTHVLTPWPGMIADESLIPIERFHIDSTRSPSCPNTEHPTDNARTWYHSRLWNFQKYMIDEEGRLVGHVPPRKRPECREIVSWIKKG